MKTLREMMDIIESAQTVAEDVSGLTDAEYNTVARYAKSKYPAMVIAALGRNPDGSVNVRMHDTKGLGITKEFKVRFAEPEETDIDEQGVAEGSFAHDQLKGEINDLFKPVVLQIVKWARAEGMTAKDLAGTSSHFFLDALDPDTYDRTQHLPDNYFNKLMDKANAKAVEILNKEFQKSVKEDQLEETEVDPVRRIEELFNNK